MLSLEEVFHVKKKNKIVANLEVEDIIIWSGSRFAYVIRLGPVVGLHRKVMLSIAGEVYRFVFHIYQPLSIVDKEDTNARMVSNE